MREKNSLDTSKYIPIAIVTGHGIRKSGRQKGILQCCLPKGKAEQDFKFSLTFSPLERVCV